MWRGRILFSAGQKIVEGAACAFGGEAAKKALGMLSGRIVNPVITLKTRRGTYEHNLSKPLGPRFAEIPEFARMDMSGLRATYFKHNEQTAIDICGVSGWELFLKHVQDNPEHDRFVYINQQETSFLEAIRQSGLEKVNSVASVANRVWYGQQITAVIGNASFDEVKFEKAEEILEDKGFEFDEKASAAIWQAGYKEDIFDAQVDGWVGLGLPEPFGVALKLAKKSEVPCVTAQWHKRKVTVDLPANPGVPSSPNDKKEDDYVASYVSFKVVRDDNDLVVATIAMWSQNYTIPDEKGARGPRASRALKEYAMMSAKKFWVDETKKEPPELK